MSREDRDESQPMRIVDAARWRAAMGATRGQARVSKFTPNQKRRAGAHQAKKKRNQ